MSIFVINIYNIDKSVATGYTDQNMRSTREAVLLAIRAQGKCTVKELAQAVGISPVSVRHHLTRLQVDGMIASEEVRQGVGRPHHAFSLTSKALEMFPTRFFRLTNLLMDEIKANMSPEQVDVLLSRIAKSIVDDYKENFENLPIEAGLPHLMELLSKEGFETRINLHQNQIIIQMLNCPYTHLPLDHPELCKIERTIIALALSLPEELVKCEQDDAAYCVITIPLEAGDLQV
jgi:predicted ArsR family transcriptional regulator